MASADQSLLVPFGASQPFAPVEDVEQHPALLPWCAGLLRIEPGQRTAVIRIDIEIRAESVHST